MTERYQIIVSNTQGQQYAVATDESPDFISFYCTRIRNAPGECRLEVDGTSDVARFFEFDSLIRLERRAPEYGIDDFYTEWEGFLVSPRYETLEDGRTRFICTGSGYLDLARREEIGYKAGTPQVAKSGPGETVIKEFVNENIGPGATSAARVVSSQRPGLTIQADRGRGSAWDGSRAWQGLLATIQEIADATQVAFDIVAIGPAQFEFRVYAGQRGLDRTTVGLNQATGKNAAGNAPVIFSVDRGNMKSASLQITRSDEVNTVYVLGQGEEDDREVLVVSDPLSLAVSPWNRRAISRNAVQEATDGLPSVGQAVLAERRVKSVFTFQPLDTQSTFYGRHFFFGDRVTAEYQGTEYHVTVGQVDLTVNSDGIDRRFTFS